MIVKKVHKLVTNVAETNTSLNTNDDNSITATKLECVIA